MTIEERLTTSGERLKRARIIAGLSTRKDFEKKHNISANTLQGWEQCKNPLTQKGATRIVNALKKEGLICTVDWLLSGMGLPPRTFESLHAGVNELIHENESLSELNMREEEAIYKETQFFKNAHPNSIILTIADNAMEPYFSIGDTVGGVQIPNNGINKYLNSCCIVELENNLILPRVIHVGTQKNTYTISCSNHKTTASPLNLFNAKIISLAPVVWHRRKLTSLQVE